MLIRQVVPPSSKLSFVDEDYLTGRIRFYAYGPEFEHVEAAIMPPSTTVYPPPNE
jgi:hypothetical protein